MLPVRQSDYWELSDYGFIVFAIIVVLFLMMCDLFWRQCTLYWICVQSTASQQLSCINHKFILGVCVCSTCIVCYFHNFCKQKSNGKGLNVYNMTTGCFKLTWAEGLYSELISVDVVVVGIVVAVNFSHFHLLLQNYRDLAQNILRWWFNFVQ